MMRVRWKHGKATGIAVHPETLRFNPSGKEYPGAFVKWDDPKAMLGHHMAFFNLVFIVPAGRRVI